MNVKLKSLILDHLEEDEKILITGASGWLGRETIELLAESLGNQFSSKVVLAGSKSRFIRVNKDCYAVTDISSISQDSHNFGIILHLAFLSQDKVEQYGAKRYTEVNEEITDLVVHMTLTSGARYIFVASSGAASEHILENQKHPGKKLYGELKYKTENRFLGISTAKVLIGRIWSISGNQIQEPLKYAIGNFIHQAVNNGSIKLIGSPHSTRTYIDAKQMMTGYIFQLLTSKNFLLNSGGETTDLHRLAKRVLLKYNPAGLLVQSEAQDQIPDYYTSPDNEMKGILIRYSLGYLSLDQQIENTGYAIRIN